MDMTREMWMLPHRDYVAWYRKNPDAPLGLHCGRHRWIEDCDSPWCMPCHPAPVKGRTPKKKDERETWLIERFVKGRWIIYSGFKGEIMRIRAIQEARDLRSRHMRVRAVRYVPAGSRRIK